MAPQKKEKGVRYNFLIGEFRHSLDEKNRLLIPSKFRPFLEEGFVLMPWFNECIVLVPMRNFFPLHQRLVSLPMEDPSAQRILQFFGGAQEGHMDKQGRVVIPEELRRYAHMEREVVVAGRVSYIEIWSAVVWEFYRKTLSPETIQQDLAKFSLSWSDRSRWAERRGGDEGEEPLPPTRPGRRRG